MFRYVSYMWQRSGVKVDVGALQLWRSRTGHRSKVAFQCPVFQEKKVRMETKKGKGVKCGG